MEVLTCESYDEVLGPRFVPSWTSRFRTKDPIQNLAIKITLTKVKEPSNNAASPMASSHPRRQRSASDKEHEDEHPPEESPPASPKMDTAPAQTPMTPMPSSPIPKSQIRPVTRVFNWQQKVFGMAQLIELRNDTSDTSHTHMHMQAQVRSEDASRSSRGLPAFQGQPLFSKVDSEGPANPFSGDWEAAEGGRVPPTLEKVANLCKKQDRNELHKWESFEGMAIYAEIEGESSGTEVQRSYEQPLLYIKHSASGLVEMQPCFNNEEQVVHQFTTPYGVVYHYQIENVNVLSKLQENDVAAVDELNKQLKRTRLKNEVGTKFSALPAWPSKKVFMFGEIVSCTGFEAAKEWHFVEAQLVLPDRVSLDPSCTAAVANAEVATQMSKPSLADTGEGVWHFGLPFELELREEAHGGSLPRLYLCVNSVDSWERHRVEGYSHVDIPLVPGMHTLTASSWKPKGSIRESMQDYFVGGALQLAHHQHPAPPSSLKTRCLSYHGLETKASGSVTVRVNVVVQHSGKGAHDARQAPNAEQHYTGPRKESAAEVEEREMEEMELRARLVKRAQDRVNKYNILDGSTLKKSPVRRRPSVRKTEPTEVRRERAEEEAGAPSTGKLGASSRSLGASSRSLRGSQRLPRRPRQPLKRTDSATPVAETIEANVLAEPAGEDEGMVDAENSTEGAPSMKEDEQ